MKYWTLLSGTSYVASIGNLELTSNPKQAVKYANIKLATAAADHWKRKHGLPVMVYVHLLSDADYEDQAHSAFYGENL
tara:strand:+ start:248 stop:481 length:234 start_codon:yes stop_codon:yes gene_type:complete